jgi:hypothetical protein
MNAKLITIDKAFSKIALLQTEDWSLPASDLTQ